MNYIHSYGDSGSTVGIDILTWSDEELSGNVPFIISTAITVTNYTNITSIENWENFGEAAGMRHCDVRLEIKAMYEQTTWSACTFEEKYLLSQFFLVDKPMRDEVMSDEEQERHNHFMIYHFISDDVMDSMDRVDLFMTPKSIDYKKDLKIRLHPKLTFSVEGWLTEVIYYENLNVSFDTNGFSEFNYDTPVVKYTASYTLGSGGYVTTREVTRAWALMDGSWSDDTKKSLKIYEPLLSRAEGVRRRKNLINRLIIDVVGLIIMTSEGEFTTISDAETNAVPFMHEVESAISAYYESGSKEDSEGNPCDMIQTVMASTYPPLDKFVPNTDDTVTIRMFIVSRINV